ncbi:MAG TPA: DUF3999 family protein, partial [Rhodanobacteraceae bacterium]|nr:DUF3999 family protein [Rhodanobacteraceae bacterium]
QPAAETAPSATARFDYALQAALPVESARIELVDDNALAPLTLLVRGSDADAAWRLAGHVTAFRLRQSGEPLRNGDIDVSTGTRVGAFRIESRTALAAPPRLSLGYRPDTFVFLAEGKPPYVLAAGSAVARRPSYPVEPALASLRASLGKDWQPPLAKLGGARPSGGDAALRTPPAPFAWRRWVLWGALVVGALLIAVLALSLLRGAKPPE